MSFSFKEFLARRELCELSKPDKPEPADHLDTIDKVLGIPVSEIPDTISTLGQLDLYGEGIPLVFNTAIWMPVKPIHEDDKYIKLLYFDANKTDRNFTRAFVKQNGKLVPYQGILPKDVTISKHKLSEMLGRGLKAAVAGGT